MTMEDQENGLDTIQLRQELKEWEKSFITANDGRKPGRADIKKNTSIAAKYKEYDRMRRTGEKLSATRTSAAAPRHPDQGVLQERAANAVTSTPKRTPSKRKYSISHASILSPVQEIEPTPAFIRCALGPTPQKDGQVLGIFDSLSTGTPSKSLPVLPDTHVQAVAFLCTPSKVATSGPIVSKATQPSVPRSPLDVSVGTPLKRKREEDHEDDVPPSTVKRTFATPSFLRRSFPLATIEEDSAEPTISGRPFVKCGLVRSLSSLIQGLRKQEEQRMDEDWDILNEMEEEQNSDGIKKKANVGIADDSQAAEMPLGPDQASVSSDEATDADAQPTARKPWKKKGLKRQTRRVIMRPVQHKAAKAQVSGITEETDDESVQETQRIQRRSTRPPIDEDDDDYGSDGSLDAGETATKNRSSTAKAKESSSRGGAEKEKDGKPKGIRKISAQAHANFRKLKIKNKNSKAKGRGGRFGRR